MFYPDVKTVPLPAKCRLWSFHDDGDFIDGYRVAAPFTPREAAEIAMKFPAWVYALMGLRQIVMWPFGLKGRAAGSDTISIFPVTEESDSEMILGFNDKHLDFRIAIFSTGSHVHCGTWVRRNNWLGRAYLFVIMPLHVFITRQMLARVARAART
ncbi:DUF2867 domain-containing protein [Roseovarius pelagicus]|uniref:DUF2867 domain-containing protein n=1 Tax=Roseovarius pelagicus TaxID=2980108 RepID=A0ABY6DDA2_9RHOB|nr:DUF2867 domain-containing protein [Roseovarius pelagicus]UXX84121.1 DUF2867 domain-containing protein [Roseovarius pelagicus]